MGCRLVSYLSHRHEVVAPTHAEMDICSLESLMRVFQEQKPKVVIHCAALSNTWYCEQHPEESYQTNVVATRNVALACKEVRAKLIFMSSDQVYNGTPIPGPLPEDAPLAPMNHYGRHKLQAEQEVMALLPSAVGLRLTWMYDRPDSPFRLNTNILVNLQNAHEKGETVKAAVHEHRGVTSVWEVVRNMSRCFRVHGGIYNYGCENGLNSYETFSQCAKLLDTQASWVLPDEERFRSQPRNIAMDTARMRAYGIEFPDTLTGLRKVITGK